MRRRILYSVLGSGVLLALVGCGRVAFEQRAAWRGEAEVSCLRSGAIKEGATRVAIRPIGGPGICGADHPFKIMALGSTGTLGYDDEVRPPGTVSRGFPIPPPRATYPYQPSTAASDAPISLHAPGTEVVEDEEPDAPDTAQLDVQGAGARTYQPPPEPRYGTQQAYTPPRLGPAAPSGALEVSAATVSPAATLACPLVSRLDQWVANSVQPSAQRWFGQPIVEIKQISAYSCRGMNGQRGAPISEHAFGNALDVAGFVLADGRRVMVRTGWHGAPEEQGFLRDVQASACETFSTVLAPGSNRFHYDHIHVDMARRRSGRVVCNPRPVPGDQIARRAQDRMVTGSVRGGRMGFATEDTTPEVQLPVAIPGQD